MADSYSGIVWWGALPPKEAFPKAKAAATKALELDDALAEGHNSMGAVREYCDWDWEGAEREYKRAIELNGNYPTGHQWYGELLSEMGRHDEAIVEVKQAQALDPLSLIISAVVGKALYYARQYDVAIEQLRKALELDPNFPGTHFWIARAYEQKGQHAQAIAEFQRAITLERNPLFMAGLACAYAAAGRRGEARQMLSDLTGLSKRKYVDPASIAIGYTGLGEKDQAFGWLEKAYERRSTGLAYLKVSPIYDPLRSDPRFQDLLRRMNFPP